MPDPIVSSSNPVIRPKIGKNVLEFWVIFISIVLLIGSLGAFAIAKTGLIHIPLFSRAYHGPQPIRVVHVAPMSGDAFIRLLNTRFVSAVTAGTQPPIRIKITEEELTAALDDSIGRAIPENAWIPRGMQIVLTPTGMELSGKLVGRVVTVDMLIRLVPHVEGDIVHFVPTYVQVGDYPVQPDLAHNAAALLFSRDFGQWNVAYGEIDLTDIRVSDGLLELIASPKKSKL